MALNAEYATGLAPSSSSQSAARSWISRTSPRDAVSSAGVTVAPSAYREGDPPLGHELELRVLWVAAADLPGRERRGDGQMPQLERVEVFAAVLARGPLTEPQRLARGHDLVPRAGKAGHGAAGEPYRFAGECGRVGRGLHQHHAVPTVRRHAYDRSLLQRRHVGPLSRLAAVDQPGGARIRSQEHRAVRVAGEERVARRLVARSEDAEFRAHAATIPSDRFLVTPFPRTIPPLPCAL